MYPSAVQMSFGWAHNVCTRAALDAALADPDVDKVESDILISSITGEAVMAHPPASHSDLTFESFIDAIIFDGRKHLKLDFKDMNAVAPCLQYLAAHTVAIKDNCQTVWLNADVLPGPGHLKSTNIPKDSFIFQCTKLFPEGVLSLGWKVDAQCGEAYTVQQCEQMTELLEAFDLVEQPVVLAVAARLMAVNAEPVIKLLVDRLPNAQLLIWTGTGEPSLGTRVMKKLLVDLKGKLPPDRYGFDVALQEESAHNWVAERWPELLGLAAVIYRCYCENCRSSSQQGWFGGPLVITAVSVLCVWRIMHTE